MSGPDRSRVLHLADARARIPGPAGEHAVSLWQRGTLNIKLSCPVRPNQQTPHAQDEVYVIIRGQGVLIHDGKRDEFVSGDLLFVAAGTEHHFEDFTDDLAVWVPVLAAHRGNGPHSVHRMSSNRRPQGLRLWAFGVTMGVTTAAERGQWQSASFNSALLVLLARDCAWARCGAPLGVCRRPSTLHATSTTSGYPTLRPQKLSSKSRSGPARDERGRLS